MFSAFHVETGIYSTCWHSCQVQCDCTHYFCYFTTANTNNGLSFLLVHLVCNLLLFFWFESCCLHTILDDHISGIPSNICCTKSATIRLIHLKSVIHIHTKTTYVTLPHLRLGLVSGSVEGGLMKMGNIVPRVRIEPISLVPSHCANHYTPYVPSSHQSTCLWNSFSAWNCKSVNGYN